MHPGDLNLTTQVTGHGRFLFVRLPQSAAHTDLARALDHLGVGMENMYDVEGTPSAEALQRGRFQFLRAEPALSMARDIPHAQMLEAHSLVYLEAATPEPLVGYEEALRTLLEPQGGVIETLAGVQRPRSYTSYAMTQFAYAPAFTPKPGGQCPLGVVMPHRKTASPRGMPSPRRRVSPISRVASCTPPTAMGARGSMTSSATSSLPKRMPPHFGQ